MIEYIDGYTTIYGSSNETDVVAIQDKSDNSFVITDTYKDWHVETFKDKGGNVTGFVLRPNVQPKKTGLKGLFQKKPLTRQKIDDFNKKCSMWIRVAGMPGEERLPITDSSGKVIMEEYHMELFKANLGEYGVLDFIKSNGNIKKEIPSFSSLISSLKKTKAMTKV